MISLYSSPRWKGGGLLFKKILIANRGEIAARIMRTCMSLGIQTVGIYSEADRTAPHVAMADEAYEIGGPRVQDSYLNGEKILQIAKESGAEAIHPGYGLLSENASFARRCDEEGIVFVGPRAEVIARMGSKIEARKAMEESGVPIVPGIAQPLADESEAAEMALRLGYPVMLKASAGGGGIGMQLVRNEKELRQAFAGNQKRAFNFFGNGEMYLEKAIANPRHIEIQVLADQHGNAVFLWERECSIQRRHQKVVEEALSPFVDESLRQRMGLAALKAVRALSYDNVGTVEFLVDEEKNFYFLEMNTRLQVEHPVTEEITGLDLVEEMLRVSAGETLRWKQEDIRREGHAIEVRIYAEDPQTFFPSPGTIQRLVLPQGEGIRHELAVSERSVVTPFYDPMIGKLIVRGCHRTDAVNKLQQALNAYEIEGIKTNLPFLRDIATHPAFCRGETTTRFVSDMQREKQERLAQK